MRRELIELILAAIPVAFFLWLLWTLVLSGAR